MWTGKFSQKVKLKIAGQVAIKARKESLECNDEKRWHLETVPFSATVK
jgi:hypothetical protein